MINPAKEQDTRSAPPKKEKETSTSHSPDNTPHMSVPIQQD